MDPNSDTTRCDCPRCQANRMERGALVTRVAELEVAVRAVVANAIPVAVIAGDVYELPRKVVDELQCEGHRDISWGSHSTCGLVQAARAILPACTSSHGSIRTSVCTFRLGAATTPIWSCARQRHNGTPALYNKLER